MAEEKFHFKVGDVVQIEATNIGNSGYGDWQYIKFRTPNNKSNCQIFLKEINEQIHAGDYVRFDELDVYPRQAKVENTKGELKWVTIFKVDAVVSLAENQPGFDTPMMDADPEQLPF